MYSAPLIVSCLVTLATTILAESETLVWDSLETERVQKEMENDPEMLLSEEYLDGEWKSFKINFGKLYENEEEELRRKTIFSENLRNIEMHNKLYSQGLKSYTLGVNQFSDMEHVEFVEQMTGSLEPEPFEEAEAGTFLPPHGSFKLPTSLDWRAEGYVTPVKDQENCSSCWAFAATGALEGQHFRKFRKLVSLSEQNLIDCSRSFHNHGCKGGFIFRAFEYVKKNNGIDTEQSYPYKAKDQHCQFVPSFVGAKSYSYVLSTSKSEKDLLTAVATVGPVAVCIHVESSFQHYKNAIFDEPKCNKTRLNHAVLVVGYGTTLSGTDYWIVKNSWGVKWGMGGYILVARNKNQCGIATRFTYPLV